MKRIIHVLTPLTALSANLNKSRGLFRKPHCGRVRSLAQLRFCFVSHTLGQLRGDRAIDRYVTLRAIWWVPAGVRIDAA